MNRFYDHHLYGKTVLVLGLGESGTAMAHWASQNGCYVRVADTRGVSNFLTRLRDRLGANSRIEAVTGSDWSENWLEKIDLIAWSPGLSIERGASAEFYARAQSKGIPVIGELELFIRALQNIKEIASKNLNTPNTKNSWLSNYSPKLIAITGTNGKTTTTSLVQHFAQSSGLSAQCAGNIRPSLLDALLEGLREKKLPEVWSLELSSFQLALWKEEIADFCFDASVIMNLTEDHLDWHSSMANYFAAKQKIHKQSKLLVLDRDDPISTSFLCKSSKNLVTFGLGPGEVNSWGIIHPDNQEACFAYAGIPLVECSKSKLHGDHNRRNILAALALCSPLKIEASTLRAAIQLFEGIPHRCTLIKVIDGIFFYDDSKGTNVGASCAALKGLNKKCRLIAGGEGKGQDFSPLSQNVAQYASGVYLIGKDAVLIESALSGTGIPMTHCKDLVDAVIRAKQDASPGEAVLLSPACASFDMFKDYEHRAEVFISAVKNL